MIMLSILIRFKTKLRYAPDDVILGIVSVFSFVMSVFWIWLFANIMIDLLKVLGLLSGLPTTLLGFTVLAWGNSIGDFMANTAIAKKGFIEMALTGCYAAPLFNILLGLGISTLKMNIFIEGHDGIRFSAKDPDSAIPLVLMIGTIVGLVFTLIMTTIVNKNVITKTQAKLNLFIYGVTLIFVLFKARY
jgi:solute carrier family 24 (sodium/potassium/calcium exchanger), member 6